MLTVRENEAETAAALPSPRGATPGEIPAIVALCNRVFRPERGDMGGEYPLLFHPENAARLRTAWESNQVLCHAGYLLREAWIQGASFSTALVGAVCTHPEHRGRGLASAVMQDLEKQAREEGCDLMLVSGGRGLYRRMGCSAAGRFCVFRVNVESLVSTGLKVRPAALEDARTLVGLHQKSAVRFERSVDDWKLMLGSGFLMNRRADTWIVESGEQAVAYLGIQRPSEDGIPRVLEYGGSAVAAWGAIRQACPEATAIDIVEMPGDPELPLLASAEAARSERSFPGTIKVLNPARFFDKAEALFYERIGQEASNDLMVSAPGDTVTFGWQGEERDVAVEELPALLFDSVEPSHPDHDGPLASILKALFPIPLVWYGYNYT